MIQHYFKIAFRNLWKYKTQNIISIIGLAVGLLCFSICMYCTRFVHTTNHCFANYTRIAELNLYDTQSGRYSFGTPTSLPEELRTWAMNEAEAITCMAYPRERSFMIEISPEKALPYTLEMIEVDTLYNKVFTPRLIAGSWKTTSRTQNAIVLSQSTAVKIFGKAEAAVGKHFTLSSRLYTSPESTPKTGGITYTVQAVMEDIPLNNGFNFMTHTDAFVLNDSEGLFQSSKRHDMAEAGTYVLLAPQTSIADLEKQISKRNYTCTLHNNTYAVAARPIGTFLQEEGAYVLGVATGIVGTLILLVGLINFFHFLIGSFLNRTKEYSIMKMSGCNGRQQFSLLFVQSLIIVLASFFLVMWGIELTSNKLDFSLMGISMNFPPGVLMKQAFEYMVLLILLSAVVCLFISARIRRISVQTGIRGGNKRRGKQWGRNLMLGIQFFICWIFVALTVGLFLQSEKTTATLFHTLSTQEKAAILSISLDYPFLKNEEKLEMVERFKQHAGVKDVLLSDIAYMQGMSGNSLMTEKGNDNSWVDVDIQVVPTNFFTFMNIPIKEGKAIQTKKDVVVDETWQKNQAKNVIGMNLYDHSTDYTVCGVCAPFQTDVHNRSGGYAFLLYDPSVYVAHCYIKCYPEQQKEVLKWIEKVRREMLPENISPQVHTFLDDIHDVQALEYVLKNILSFFAMVSIVITLLGVYSSITLDTEHRRKEVAIRKINGAGMGNIIWLFARLYGTLLAATALIAFPIIYVILQLWKQIYTVFFQYGFLFWGGIFIAVAIITALTVWFRILKIARINPVEAVKNE